jgi:hypothetical protein
MSSRRSVRQLLVAVLFGVLVGGGLMAVTPAGAEVSNAVATNWKKIWKKNLKPLADRRYYTKAQGDAKYSTKAESAAGDAASNAATDTKLGGYYKKAETYSKAEADAKYAGAGSSYSKAESDGKYVAKPALITGGYYATGYSEGGTVLSYVVDFGANLSSAPTVHYVETGAAPPAQCPGTVSAPDAAPGHLCVYETGSGGLAAASIINFAGASGAETTGATIFALVSGAGVDRWMRGRWAVRPGPDGFNGQGRPQVGATPSGPAGVGGAN